ncbi:hypothetical protein TKK_0013619 [Trichogramma kaykai]
MSSDDESAESFHSCESDSDAEIDNYDLKDLYDLHQEQLESLKSLRDKIKWIYWINKINWFNKGRYAVLDQLYLLISDWKGRLPDLRDIFFKREIEFLLMDCINFTSEGARDNRGQLFIEFVARSGYKDEPDFDKNGNSLLRRTTPLHNAVTKLSNYRKRGVVRELFKIYDRFNVNYTDKSGFTHLHVACCYGFDDIAEKFLDHGHNPNCLNEDGDSPLNAAIDGRSKEVVSLLLRNGANPNLANKEGFTPLHIFSWGYKVGELWEFEPPPLLLPIGPAPFTPSTSQNQEWGYPSPLPPGVGGR